MKFLRQKTLRGWEKLVTFLCQKTIKRVNIGFISYDGMEYVIWAKGPALGPVRSFSANIRREKK